MGIKIFNILVGSEAANKERLNVGIFFVCFAFDTVTKKHMQKKKKKYGHVLELWFRDTVESLPF